MIQEHLLKCNNPYFNDIWTSKKHFEIRKNDRNFKVGDYLILTECFRGEPLKRKIVAQIRYILENFDGIEKGYCILDLLIIDKMGKR